MKTEKRFNVRVYGMILSEMDEVLVAEEFHYDTFMQKFPGGGLQFGEGPKECLRRELREELDVEVEELMHLHTTDFFVQSAFNRDHQVLGIYFLVKAPLMLSEKFRGIFVKPTTNGTESFRWIKLNELQIEEFTFPVDRQGAEVLIENWKEGQLK
ncbi:hypothetical protein BH11BAC2_BH11BAC2_13780 [soil metagenome]